MNRASLLAAAAVATLATRADDLPSRLYRGAVAGTVVVGYDADSCWVSSSNVAEKSNVMGRATQVFTAVDISLLPYQTSGLITSVDKHGDTLELSFVLVTTAQLSATDVEFVGEFHVLGGTGRYDFVGPTLTGDYGSGTIAGTATLDFGVPGAISLTFQDRFAGTVAEAAE